MPRFPVVALPLLLLDPVDGHAVGTGGRRVRWKKSAGGGGRSRRGGRSYRPGAGLSGCGGLEVVAERDDLRGIFSGESEVVCELRCRCAADVKQGLAKLNRDLEFEVIVAHGTPFSAPTQTMFTVILIGKVSRFTKSTGRGRVAHGFLGLTESDHASHILASVTSARRVCASRSSSAFLSFASAVSARATALLISSKCR